MWEWIPAGGVGRERAHGDRERSIRRERRSLRYHPTLHHAPSLHLSSSLALSPAPLLPLCLSPAPPTAPPSCLPPTARPVYLQVLLLALQVVLHAKNLCSERLRHHIPLTVRRDASEEERESKTGGGGGGKEAAAASAVVVVAEVGEEIEEIDTSDRTLINEDGQRVVRLWRGEGEGKRGGEERGRQS